MRQIVEKIKSYYEKGIYSETQVDAMYRAGKITDSELDYIKGI